MEKFGANGGPVKESSPFASVIKDENYLFVSGTGGYDPETGKIADYFLGQAEQVLKNLIRNIKAAGGDPDKIVKTTCFIKDMSQYKEFNELFHKYLPCQPTRSCIEVSRLPVDMLIEIEAIVKV
jgi:2-iminobutanoate/2-iminopropanoate deaminase